MNIAYSGFIAAIVKAFAKNKKSRNRKNRFLFILLILYPVLLFAPLPSFAIDAPNQPSGIQTATNEIQWEWQAVPGAARYDVIVDYVFQTQTTDTRFTSVNLAPGEHHLAVKAIGPDWQYSEKSDLAIVFLSSDGQASNGVAAASASIPSDRSIGAPTNPRGAVVSPGRVKWEWAAGADASLFEVNVDGITEVITDALNWNSDLSDGEHFMTVRAISADGNYSEHSSIARVYVGAGGDSAQPQTQAAISPPAPAPAENDNGLIDPQTWSQPGVGKPNYNLVFSDEFNASQLNPNRWNSQLRWDGEFNGERYEYRTVNGEDQFYVNILSDDQQHLDTVVPGNNPFEFNGSRLAIRAKRNPLKQWNADKKYGPLYDMVSQQTFLSGAISTYDKFTQKYGFFEARIKIPKQLGTFPAFWLHHQRREWEGTNKTEIDIMENLGHAPQYVYNSFHYFTGVSEGVTGNPHLIKPQPEGQIYTGINYNEDYHVYAVEWEPGYLAFQIDGQVVSELWNDNVNHEELYVILNMAIGGDWTNYPTSAGGTGRQQGNHFPNQNDVDTWSNPALEIDYIRVYKRQ